MYRRTVYQVAISNSAITCSYDLVEKLTPATPERIENFFTNTRTDLFRMITDWEKSGQGEGGRDQEDDAVDEADNDDDVPTSVNIVAENTDRHRALHSRSSFLNGKPSYLLYYWELAEEHQLLASSLQRLSNDVGAIGASSAPLIYSATGRSSITGSGDRTTRHQEEHDEDSILYALVESLQHLVESQRNLLADRAIDREHDRRENSRKRRFERRSTLMDLARKYRRDYAELGSGNDEHHKRLSDHFVSELSALEKEIRELESVDVED